MNPAVIQKAQELQPDMILLDIGLPRLNGIEAAHRIRQVSRRSKILFISEYASPDIAKEALHTGAHGYLVKADSGNELLPAVAAILQGKQFASATFGGQTFIDALPGGTADDPPRGGIVAEPKQLGISCCHEVASYADEASFADGLARFVQPNLKARNAVIVIGTEQHRAGILARLNAEAMDIAGAIHNGRYIAADTVETLSKFMAGDMPDESRLMTLVTELIQQAANVVHGEHGRVVVCGELAPVLLAQGNVEGAMGVEQLSDNIVRTHGIDLLCGYLSSTFQRSENDQAFERVCAEHSAVH